MGDSDLQGDLLRDQRVAPYALSTLPAWLWRADGSRVLWANPIGAAIFGAPSSAVLTTRIFDLGQPSAAQIARLAPTLLHGGPPRLERLRAFGAGVGRALTCNCTRLVLHDSTSAILVVATERAGPELTLSDRIEKVLAGLGEAAAFSQEGRLVQVGGAASRLADVDSLAAIGAEALGAEALAKGHAVGQSRAGLVALDVVGSGPDAILLLTFPPVLGLEPGPETSVTPKIESDEPASPNVVEAPASAPLEISTPAEADVAIAPAAPTQSEVATHASLPPEPDRRHPLRFVWQMDADGHFTLGSEEFSDLVGPCIAGALGRLWSEIASDLGLDPEGQVARAVATRNTWSGITVHWPVEGASERLAVELSGLPIFDRDRSFRGYRGFGICRDVARLGALAQARRFAMANPATTREAERPDTNVPQPVAANVVRFPTPAPSVVVEANAPVLSANEDHAFREIARQLNDRLQEPPVPEVAAAVNSPAEEGLPESWEGFDADEEEEAPRPGNERPILDRVPAGVLVYRLDHLLYANRAFLEWTGHENLSALEEAGGLDCLLIEQASGATDGGGQTLTLTGSQGNEVSVQGRLFTIPWNGEQALALVLSPAGAGNTVNAMAELKLAQTEARQFKAILDTAADAVLVLDRAGRVASANRGAESLFGYDAPELLGRAVADLLMPESAQLAREQMERLIGTGRTEVHGDSREVTGRSQQGGQTPLMMTLAPLPDDPQKFSAVFRDITRAKKTEEDLVEAKREAERASATKSAFLAKISHEIRTPLNAIIGFSEVMMAERFGPIGNERYSAYLRDIHASGGHVVSLLNDLLDLSKIEAGKMDLTFTSVGLNDLTQQCVAIMQPQANKERIIIRTSLSPKLPQIVADARSVRQIVLNLLSNSIKFTGAGGQVIVSSALNDNGQVVLRVRDTGVGMSEDDIATALEPFRQLATAGRWGSGGTGLGLPLTKALAEANRASFSIKSAVNAGTLVEVAFAATRVPAE